MGKKIEWNKTMIKGIAAGRAGGMEVKELADLFGMTEGSMKNAVMIIGRGERKDIEGLAKYLKDGYAPLVKAVCEAYAIGTQLVEEIAFPKPAAEVKPAPVAKPKEEVKPKGNEELYFAKMLEAQAKTNELLEQLMDVVLPKLLADAGYAADARASSLAGLVKGTVETATDVLTNEMLAQSKILDGIRCNCKRGR